MQRVRWRDSRASLFYSFLKLNKWSRRALTVDRWSQRKSKSMYKKIFYLLVTVPLSQCFMIDFNAAIFLNLLFFRQLPARSCYYRVTCTNYKKTDDFKTYTQRQQRHTYKESYFFISSWPWLDFADIVKVLFSFQSSIDYSAENACACSRQQRKVNIVRQVDYNNPRTNRNWIIFLSSFQC